MEVTLLHHEQELAILFLIQDSEVFIYELLDPLNIVILDHSQQDGS